MDGICNLFLGLPQQSLSPLKWKKIKRGLMKFCFFMALMILAVSSAFATEIEITSDDCNFEVRKERDSTILRVSKIIAIENSVSVYEIDLPDDRIKLPLEDGMETSFLNSTGDEASLTFKNGILIHDLKAKTNFTRDTLELHISANLKHIRTARFTRKGTGILSLFGSEKFECTF
jgi:hypothetical protein